MIFSRVSRSAPFSKKRTPGGGGPKNSDTRRTGNQITQLNDKTNPTKKGAI